MKSHGADIAVPPNDHELILSWAPLQIWIQFMLCAGICTAQLDMVMIVVDGKRAFKDRLDTVSLHKHARPADVLPFARAILYPRCSFEHLVV